MDGELIVNHFKQKKNKINMEKIIKIEETNFRTEDGWSSYDGYQIITDKQVIKLGISTEQSCCESWGYFMSEDNLAEYEGAGLIKVELVDEALQSKGYDEVKDWGETALMFVNIHTDRGLLQFTAYNCHNGYYGHNAVVISEQLNHCECL